MAKRSKDPPAARLRDNESLLLRSAESLGRIIGSLQRELDGATRATKDAGGRNGSGRASPGTRRNASGARKPVRGR